jgi:hypothetical protein
MSILKRTLGGPADCTPCAYGDGAAEGVALTFGHGLAGQGGFGTAVADAHDATS